ncbi:TetR/AcrR family transcriptional regulator [Clostridioides sp. ES-S-0145-01]|uniref:TetR/AcrR family transcriptional regulator n=1 Tax=Clostridioides sp. ES-S-0145-01 TaxID=2770784 RepID=UPI001D0FD95E|nr:TetR/AcrR family transcriptional regulator [Clostridioides sp. ES-S-0145-01]
MSVKERRKKEKIEMKKKIMDAAIEIINQEGYENLSIRKIATKIEYSPTTIYLYYKDKAQIINDMANELYNKIENDSITVMDKYSSFSVDKQIREIMLTFIKILSSNPEMTKAIMYSGMNIIFASQNTASTPANNGIEMFDKLLAIGIKQKIFKPNIDNASWMLISALLGFVLCAVENHLYSLHNFSQFIDNFVDILLGGIYNEHSHQKS